MTFPTYQMRKQNLEPRILYIVKYRSKLEKISESVHEETANPKLTSPHK